MIYLNYRRGLSRPHGYAIFAIDYRKFA